VRRAALFLVLLALVLPLLGSDCQNGAGVFTFKVLGPELHDNLWQFASVRGWKAASSATSYPGRHNHARMYFDGAHFAVEESCCNLGIITPDGSTLVVVAEYTSGANTTGQRAYYAAASLVATDPIVIADKTMYEVPPVAAVNAAGTVTVSWTEPASQSEVVGYRVVRSADGLASWSTIVDKATGQTSGTDAPGSGTFFYALQIIYQNDGTNKVVSPHGLSASVTIP